MRRLLPPLLVLAVLVGSCATPAAARSSVQCDVIAVTPWGEYAVCRPGVLPPKPLAVQQCVYYLARFGATAYAQCDAEFRSPALALHR